MHRRPRVTAPNGAGLISGAHRAGGKRYGFECKLADAPGTTRSMRVALNDLDLDHLWVVYPGDEAYPLDDSISVLPIANVPDLAGSLGVGKERGACP